MPEQLSLFNDNPDYDKFLEKFQPKKTTDDCYTPPLVYEAIKDWACTRYGRDPETVVRPFYPGGDYENEEYPDGCFVLDNPPFSILSQIVSFYLHQRIPFFLFAPTLTCLAARNCLEVAHLVTDADIVYENGAVVPTSFVTNCEPGVVLRSEPELGDLINRCCKDISTAVHHPKYIYPDHVVTAAICQTYARRGVSFCVRREDCVRVSTLDSQRDSKKSIFGGGFCSRTGPQQTGPQQTGQQQTGQQQTGQQQTGQQQTGQQPSNGLYQTGRGSSFPGWVSL